MIFIVFYPGMCVCVCDRDRDTVGWSWHVDTNERGYFVWVGNHVIFFEIE